MTVAANAPSPAAWLRPALAGAAATCCGIGLSRFAYVPLFPAMVASGWVSGAEGGLLGALNLAGYLAGVLGGRALARRLGTPVALDLGMALAAIAFAGCGLNGGFAALALCRFGSGAAGGLLMALAGPAVQGAVAPNRRGAAGGIVLAGVASGIVGSAIIVPAALPLGVAAIWYSLAGAVALLWLSVRRSWPRTAVVIPVAGTRFGATPLHLAYGISGAGLVPHMVYFADLAVRGRGLSAGVATGMWTTFGIGALAGTLLGGRAADRIGALLALRIWLVLQVAALATALLPGTPFLVLSAFLGGFSALGLSTVALARAFELAGPAAGSVWVRATAAFAVSQAVTGFALAALFRQTGSHRDVFGVGLLLSVVALAVALLDRRRRPAT